MFIANIVKIQISNAPKSIADYNYFDNKFCIVAGTTEMTRGIKFNQNISDILRRGIPQGTIF